MIEDVRKVQRELEGRFAAEQTGTDEVALKLYRESPQLARDYLTRYSVERGDATVKRWKQLGESLIVKYLDGNVRNEAVGSGLNEDRIDESKSHVPVRRLVLSLRIRRHARRSGRIGRPGRSLDVR